MISSASGAGGIAPSTSASLNSCPWSRIGLLGAGAKPLVRRQPQLLLETLDLERLLAYQRLQRRRIVRQIGRAWWGLVHGPKG